MSEFNLFSNNLKKDIEQQSNVKMTFPVLILIVIAVLVIFISVIIFFANFYYSTQVKDKGNLLISLIDQQSTKYKSTIDSINSYNSKKSVTEDITKNRLLMEKVIAEIDSKSNNTINSYSIDESTGNISISGTVAKIEEAVSILQNLEKSSMFLNPSLDQVIKENVSNTNTINYTYTILFILNSEKI